MLAFRSIIRTFSRSSFFLFSLSLSLKLPHYLFPFGDETISTVRLIELINSTVAPEMTYRNNGQWKLLKSLIHFHDVYYIVTRVGSCKTKVHDAKVTDYWNLDRIWLDTFELCPFFVLVQVEETEYVLPFYPWKKKYKLLGSVTILDYFYWCYVEDWCSVFVFHDKHI